jgi:hypothetical protein
VFYAARAPRAARSGLTCRPVQGACFSVRRCAWNRPAREALLALRAGVAARGEGLCPCDEGEGVRRLWYGLAGGCGKPLRE